MNQPFTEQWSNIIKHWQEPMQKFTELNLQTLKNLNYLHPQDLLQLKKPEDLFVKQLSLSLENSHKLVDYMQNSIDLFATVFSSMQNKLHENAAPLTNAAKSAMSMATHTPIVDHSNPLMDATRAVMTMPLVTANTLFDPANTTKKASDTLVDHDLTKDAEQHLSDMQKIAESEAEKSANSKKTKKHTH